MVIFVHVACFGPISLDSSPPPLTPPIYFPTSLNHHLLCLYTYPVPPPSLNHHLLSLHTYPVPPPSLNHHLLSLRTYPVPPPSLNHHLLSLHTYPVPPPSGLTPNSLRPSAYQPNTLPLGPTGSHSPLSTLVPTFLHHHPLLLLNLLPHSPQPSPPLPARLPRWPSFGFNAE